MKQIEVNRNHATYEMLYKFDYQNTNANKLNLIDYAFSSKLLKFISDLSIHFI